MITICILIFLYTIIGKSSGGMIDRIKDSELAQAAQSLLGRLKDYALRYGRVAVRPLLQLWFVLRDDNTSKKDKVLIYGALAYILIPADLVPRRLFRFIGMVDDLAVLGWLSKKVGELTTMEINRNVEDLLDEWFGRKAISIKLIN